MLCGDGGRKKVVCGQQSEREGGTIGSGGSAVIIRVGVIAGRVTNV